MTGGAGQEAPSDAKSSGKGKWSQARMQDTPKKEVGASMWGT